MATANTEKLDLYKRHRAEYATPKTPKLIETAPAQYLAIEGAGAPGGGQFESCIGALYGMAYTIKFQSKFAGRDFVVCKLEAIYGADGLCASDLEKLPKDQWTWKMIIRVPEFIKDKHLAEARQALREKEKEGDFDAVRLETIDEGMCIQMLHIGPYEMEHETIAAMQAFAEEQGYESQMWHHEVYISDPRRVPPERLKTILRQPVRKQN